MSPLDCDCCSQTPFQLPLTERLAIKPLSLLKQSVGRWRISAERP